MTIEPMTFSPELSDSGLFHENGNVAITTYIGSQDRQDRQDLANALTGVSIAVDHITKTLIELNEHSAKATPPVVLRSLQDIRDDIERTEARIRAIHAPESPKDILAIRAAAVFAAHGIQRKKGLRKLHEEHTSKDDRLPMLTKRLASLQTLLAEREAAEAGQEVSSRRNAPHPVIEAVQSFLFHMNDVFGTPHDFQWATPCHILNHIVTAVQGQKSVVASMPDTASQTHVRQLKGHIDRMDADMKKIGEILAKHGNLPETTQAVTAFRETWIPQFRAALKSDAGSASTLSASPSTPIAGSGAVAPSGSTLAPL